MEGLKIRHRRTFKGPVWGWQLSNPKFTDALLVAAVWTEEGLKFKGTCPVCHDVMLDDGKDCDPRGAAGENAEAHICAEDGSVLLSVCWGCTNDSQRYAQACRLAGLQ